MILALYGAGALLRDRIHIGSASVVALGSAVFEDVPDHVTMIGNPARIAGESVGTAVYAPRRDLKPSPEEGEPSPKSVAERYWEVFTSCFEGMNFNPITFSFSVMYGQYEVTGDIGG